MSSSLRTRLARLEDAGNSGVQRIVERMSDEELDAELRKHLEHAALTVAWHAAHPDGRLEASAPYMAPYMAPSDVTLEMIRDSEHVEDIYRCVAEILCETRPHEHQDPTRTA